MNRIRRTVLISYWLLQSFLKRYKSYLVIAFILGIVIMGIFWRFYPTLSKITNPSKTVVGIVGIYRPNELPISIQQYISLGFTSIDESGEALPLTVTKWEVSKEGTRYFFHLDNNIYWQDGEEFTAHDVNYNFRDVTIAAADRYTLKIDLEEPFSPLPTLLSRPLFKPGLVGIGPYKVFQIDLMGDAVDTLLIKRNDLNENKVNTAYTTDIIEFHFYPSIEAAVLAFKLGEIDHIDDLPSKTALAEERNVTITEKTVRSKILALFYNQQNEFLGSKEFRQALSYATPNLTGEKANSAIPSTSWAYNKNAKHYEYDQEKAIELFEKTGIENASLILSVYPEYLSEAEVIASSWREFGLDIQIQVIRSFSPDYQILLGVQEIPSDPDQYQLWHSTQATTNITHYNNPKIDKLLEEGRTVQTKEERVDIYKEFQRYIMEDNPANFLIHPISYSISRK